MRDKQKSEEKSGWANPGKPYNILLAENNPINAMVAERFIKAMGHTTVTVKNGHEVLETLINDAFDLVLMDIEMPEMDGLEATHRIREGMSGESNRRIPVVAMTAHALAEFRARCEAVGMNDFVSKPVDFYELNTIIEKNIAYRTCGFAGFAEKVAPNRDKQVVLDQKDALRRFGGDEDFLGQVHHMFINTCPTIIEELRTAVVGNKFEDIVLYTHSLKSPCGSIGASSCFKIAVQLEHIAREERVEHIGPLFERLEEEFDKVMTLITNGSEQRPLAIQCH